MLHALDVIIKAISAFIDETVRGIELLISFMQQIFRAFSTVTTLIASVPLQFAVASAAIISVLIIINIINKGG